MVSREITDASWPTIDALLRRIHASLNDGGRVVTLEFVPNDERVTPPGTAHFSLVMLASTPSGDAYTFAEFDGMFRRAGFARSEFHPLPPTMATVAPGGTCRLTSYSTCRSGS